MDVQLRAGYAKVDITPEFPVPLGGYGNTHMRIHQTVLDPIYAICVAITDGENTILLYHLDLVYLTDHNVSVCKKEISETYGIPEKNILLNVTHTHSAPDLRSDLDSMKLYTEIFHRAVIDLAGPALADMENTRIEIGSGIVHGWNFVRRYLLENGTYGGDNFGDFKNNAILGHESEADHVMQAVRLVREHKKDILLVNWQAHPHPAGGPQILELTSDVIGRFRGAIEEENDVLFSFYQGCGGNINSHTRIAEEAISRDYTVIARGLADGLQNILTNMRPVKSGKVKTSIKVFTADINHEWDHMVESAQKVLDLWDTATKKEATALAKSLGFNSVYHANAVIRRSKMPQTLSYEIGAVSFGDVCIVWAPNELYDTTGKFLKESIPFEMNFICGYTNGAYFYMPTYRAFQHGGYECDICYYPAGTTEKLTWELFQQGLAVL